MAQNQMNQSAFKFANQVKHSRHNWKINKNEF